MRGGFIEPLRRQQARRFGELATASSAGAWNAERSRVDQAYKRVIRRPKI